MSLDDMKQANLGKMTTQYRFNKPCPVSHPCNLPDPVPEEIYPRKMTPKKECKLGSTKVLRFSGA